MNEKVTEVLNSIKERFIFHNTEINSESIYKNIIQRLLLNNLECKSKIYLIPQEIIEDLDKFKEISDKIAVEIIAHITEDNIIAENLKINPNITSDMFSNTNNVILIYPLQIYHDNLESLKEAQNKHPEVGNNYLLYFIFSKIEDFRYDILRILHLYKRSYVDKLYGKFTNYIGDILFKDSDFCIKRKNLVRLPYEVRTKNKLKNHIQYIISDLYMAIKLLHIMSYLYSNYQLIHKEYNDCNFYEFQK